MKFAVNIFTSLILLLCLSSFSAQSIAPDVIKWEKLGSRKVNFKLDKDVIIVGARDGLFSKLKLVVTGGDLNMHKMTVQYKNGQSENIQLKHKFEKKSSTRVIDLKGNKRIIKSIVFYYDTDNRSQRKATVTVFGK